jgi:hypothetical protein
VRESLWEVSGVYDLGDMERLGDLMAKYTSSSLLTSSFLEIHACYLYEVSVAKMIRVKYI